MNQQIALLDRLIALQETSLSAQIEAVGVLKELRSEVYKSMAGGGQAVITTAGLAAAEKLMPSPQTFGSERANLLAMMEGPKNVFLTYLSPSVVDGGRGYIKPNGTFCQYEEDAMTADPERLFAWPSGFYRNALTRESQFHVRIMMENGVTWMFCLDNLPLADGNQRIITRTLTGENLIKALADISNDDLTAIISELQTTMNKLIAMHFWEDNVPAVETQPVE